MSNKSNSLSSKSKNNTLNCSARGRYKKGFTLIELLVVIAIIGVLTSVVLASLNSARTKGQIAAIKSNLKNIIPQAELAYETPGNYSAVCADTKVASMLTAITNGSTYTSCLSYNNSGRSDINLRWGATALLNTSTPIQAYSVSGTGVTTWGAKGVNSSGTFVDTDVAMNWTTANTACLTAGGRLPTLEELKTLSDASFTASASHTPPSFGAFDYWSRTITPNGPAFAYYVNVATGGIGGGYMYAGDHGYAHCVR